MRFVDDAQIERFAVAKDRRSAFTPCRLPTHDVNAGYRECAWLHASFHRLNAEEPVQFVLPLTNQGLRHDKQNARSRPFRTQLCQDQTGFDGLAQPYLISQNAAPFWDALQRKNHGVDLVRIRIDPALPLGGCITLLLVGTP